MNNINRGVTYLRIQKHFGIIALLLSIFIFVLIVDPPNVLLGLKDILFILLFASCIIKYKKLNYKALRLVSLIYFIEIITLLRGILVGYSIDYTFSVFMFKTFLPLLLLFWINNLEFVSKLFFPSILVAFLTICVSVAMYNFPELELIMYNYLSVEKSLASISRRVFIGIEVTSVYYVSLPLLFIPYCLSMFKLLFESSRRLLNLALTVLFFCALLCGGTRACMLSAIAVVGTMICLKLYRSEKTRLWLYPLMTVGVILFFYLLTSLAGESQEPSNMVKYRHLESYKLFFQSNWDALLLGQGVGGMFYSLGFKEYAVQTEWTAIEFVRYFGILGGCILFAIYLLPLYLIYKKRSVLRYSIPLSLGYIIYFLIGTTNPLLVSSNGMLALLTIYSYACNPAYEYQ